MKIISFNTMYIDYEKEYNPDSKILKDYPDDKKRLLEICEIVSKNINHDTIICLQECSTLLLSMLKNKIDAEFTIFSVEIDTDIFLVTIAHVSLSFKDELLPKHLYKNVAHGYLIVSNNDIKIINCHLKPKFVTKNNDSFLVIKNSSQNKKCIVAGDFNDKSNIFKKYLEEYTIPYFGPTYKNKREIDYIIFNFKVKYEVKKLNTYPVSDHCAIFLELSNKN